MTAWDDEVLEPEVLNIRKKLINEHKAEERMQLYKRRERDDIEIDKGKIKKVKTKKPSLFSSPKTLSSFQLAYQNKINGVPSVERQLRKKKVLSKIRSKQTKR